LYRYKAVGPTPIYPLPSRGVYSGVDFTIPNSREISVVTFARFSDRAEAPKGFWGLQFLRNGASPSTQRVEFSGADASGLARFYRSGVFDLGVYPNLPRPAPVSLLSLRPGVMLLSLNNRALAVYDFITNFNGFGNASFTEIQRSFIWPREGGVFDVHLPSLPFRQFKLEVCVANTDTSQSIRYECPVQYDNGTRGKLIERDGLRFQLQYAECRNSRSIDLAPEGFGELQWYIEDRGHDPYAGTAMALKRGQLRVKLFASLREGELQLTPGPRLSPWCQWRTIVQ
jgi:hypothetical protein